MDDSRSSRLQNVTSFYIFARRNMSGLQNKTRAVKVSGSLESSWRTHRLQTKRQALEWRCREPTGASRKAYYLSGRSGRSRAIDENKRPFQNTEHISSQAVAEWACVLTGLSAVFWGDVTKETRTAMTSLKGWGLSRVHLVWKLKGLKPRSWQREDKVSRKSNNMLWLVQ